MDNCSSFEHERIRNKIASSKDYNKLVIDVSKIFSLLGEPARMKIVLALMEGELCVYHICEITGGKQSATSQHLKKLKDGGVVKFRKLSNQVLYSISDIHVLEIVKMAMEHTKCL